MSGGYLRLHFHLNRNEKRDEKSISTAEANACWFSFPHEEERKKKVFFFGEKRLRDRMFER